MPRFYVTKTWHDWPEGGSCGEVVEADDHAMAEHAMLEIMASYYADDGGFEPDDWDVEDSADIVPAIMKAHGDEWHTVDCFNLDEAIVNWVGAGDTEEPVAIAHSFDGHGYQFIDNGSGSDWIKRGMAMPHAIPLYAAKKVKSDTATALKRLQALGIRPTMTSEELMKLTRGDE